MELKVPFLADRQLESAATELLRKYAKWKGTPPRPPIPVDDIVEGLLELSLSIGDLRTRLGKNDVLGATWLDDVPRQRRDFGRPAFAHHVHCLTPLSSQL